MNAPPSYDLLSLIHDVLKQQVSATLDASWKAQVLALAERQDREYSVVTAWRNAVAEAFASLAAFPQKYRAMQGRLPIKPVALQEARPAPPEPTMTVAEHDAILAKRIATDPVFARMMKELKPSSGGQS